MYSQAKRQRERFQQKETRAKADLESKTDDAEATRLLTKLLVSSSRKEEERQKRRNKQPRHQSHRS